MGVGVQIPPCALNEKDPDTLFVGVFLVHPACGFGSRRNGARTAESPLAHAKTMGPEPHGSGPIVRLFGGPSSCLGEQSPVSHHLKILIEDCLLTQGRRANWDWCARDEPRLAVGAALWPALGGGSPLPPRESPSAGTTSNAGEMMMVCQPTRLRWSGRSRLATATGSP